MKFELKILNQRITLEYVLNGKRISEIFATITDAHKRIMEFS